LKCNILCPVISCRTQNFFLLYLAYSCFCWWWFHCCLCCWYFGVPLSQMNTEWKKIFLGVNVAFVEIYDFCSSIWWWFSNDRIFSECVNDFGVILKILRNAKNWNLKPLSGDKCVWNETQFKKKIPPPK